MDGPRNDHAKWRPSDNETPTSNAIIYMWNLKKGHNELLYRTDTDSDFVYSDGTPALSRTSSTACWTQPLECLFVIFNRRSQARDIAPRSSWDSKVESFFSSSHSLETLVFNMRKYVAPRPPFPSPACGTFSLTLTSLNFFAILVLLWMTAAATIITLTLTSLILWKWKGKIFNRRTGFLK